MPKWLTDVLVQFPVLVVMGLIFWYAHREMKRLYADNLCRADRSHAAQLAVKEREVARLDGQLAGELRTLSRRVEALNRKLS